MASERQREGLIPEARPYGRLPILVGFTGKADIGAADAADAGTPPLVARRWAASVEWLDRQIPLTPKVLMCGSDAGADLEAVKLVLELKADGCPVHPLWSVVLVRAFRSYRPRDAATEAAYAELADRFPDRIRSVDLRHLTAAPFDDTEPDAAIDLDDQGLTVPTAEAGPYKQFRADHFDQLGFWLARHSTLLFAAFPIAANDTLSLQETLASVSAEASNPGSVPRVVAFRRTALPDEPAARMLERSRELLSGAPLEDPDAGHVLWINISPQAPEPPPGEPPFSLLRPMTRVFGQHGDGTAPTPDGKPPRLSVEGQRQRIYQQPFNPYDSELEDLTPEECAHKRREFLWHALAVSRAFDRFQRRQLPLWRQALLAAIDFAPWDRLRAACWQQACRVLGGDAGVFAPFATQGAGEDPHRFLESVRSKLPLSDQSKDAARMPLDRQQAWFDTANRTILRGVICVALLAVASLETFIELLKDNWWFLLVYVGLLMAIGVVALVVNRLGWTRLAEDMRVLKEIFRVQIAWWGAGIDRRVDRVHLRSIDADLAVLREISATIAGWATLRAGAQRVDAAMQTFHRATRDWRASDDPLLVKRAAEPVLAQLRAVRRTWIVAQARYFQNSWQKQENFVRFSEQMTEIAFSVAVIVLACLLLLHAWPKAQWVEFDVEGLGRWLQAPTAAMMIPLAVWLMAVACVTHGAITHMLKDWPKAPDPSPPSSSPLTGVVPWFATLAVLAGLTLLAQPLLPAATIPPAQWPLNWAVLAIAVAAGAKGFWLGQLPGDLGSWEVKRLRRWQKAGYALAAALGLIGFSILLAPTLAAITAAPGAEAQPQPDAFPEALRALVMVSATLSLVATALLKYYVEQRNHKAQFADYRDSNRAFLRMSDLVQERLDAIEAKLNRFVAGTPELDGERARPVEIYDDVRKLRGIYVDLGELALDENEAWLHAHRERPIEVISGG